MGEVGRRHCSRAGAETSKWAYSAYTGEGEKNPISLTRSRQEPCWPMATVSCSSSGAAGSSELDCLLLIFIHAFGGDRSWLQKHDVKVMNVGKFCFIYLYIATH